MLSDWSHKTKHFFFVLIKLSIVLAAFYFIYQKIYYDSDLSFSDFRAFLIQNDMFSVKSLSFLLLLTSVNWFFEILKWQNLVKPISHIPFFEALKQTLASHTIGILTPNRIGDYGAKSLYYPKSIYKKIFLLNALGNFAQLSMTIAFGLIGLITLYFSYGITILSKTIWLYIIIGGVLVILIFAFFNVSKFKFIKQIINFTKHISSETHLKTLLFSLSRYLIFSFQFYYFLILFSVDMSYLQAMSIITVIYLCSSVIPTIFIFDAVIKGSIAIFLFGFFDVNEFIVLCITMCMWLFNFALPALFGNIFVLKFNYDTSKIYLNTE